LNAQVGEDGDEDWMGFLPDEGPSPEEVVTGLKDAESRSRWLREAIGELSDREQTIIRRRRLVEDGATLEELGKVLGVSKERVRQLEHRALQKLKVSIERRVDRPMDLLMEA
jgi:RNA polymerase sigma-32 factor